MVLFRGWIRNDQYRFLKKLLGNMSEHVRAALDDYEVRKRRELLNVSESNSLSPFKINEKGENKDDKQEFTVPSAEEKED